MGEGSLKGSKSLWEKEILLVMSNFSFSNSVFLRLVLQTRKNRGLFGKGLTKDKVLYEIKLDPFPEDKLKLSIK